jgi:hypothetical protein
MQSANPNQRIARVRAEISQKKAINKKALSDDRNLMRKNTFASRYTLLINKLVGDLIIQGSKRGKVGRGIHG